jgi:hypothetical protein
MKNITLPPLAASFTESIRDIGYSLNTAVSDIIDNSISADAKNIEIHIKNDDSNISLAIIDDGNGLEEEELVNAMRLGSKNPLEERNLNDLGRFGLGMKTASFSQCRRLTVVSAMNNIKCATQWDLDRISKTNEWDLSVLDSKEIDMLYQVENLGENGTLIIWEKCDRIADNTVEENRESYYEKIRSLEGHLKLVFHRFFEKNQIKVRINNGDPLGHFDPFARSHNATQMLPKEIVLIDGKAVYIQAYVLPHHSKLTPQQYDENAGEGGYLKNQGFYVYRGQRLIIHGTWFRMKPKSDLAKLTRIQIDLPNNLDQEWKIDAMKSQATPPQIIRDKLKTLIEKFFSKSKRIYTYKGQKKSTVADSYWNRNSRRDNVTYSINGNHPDIKDLAKSLNEEQLKEFKHLLKDLALFFPKDMFFADYGSKPENFNEADVSDDELEERALDIMKKNSKNFSIENYISKYMNSEPYSQYSKSWQDFVEKNYAEI